VAASFSFPHNISYDAKCLIHLGLDAPVYSAGQNSIKITRVKAKTTLHTSVICQTFSVTVALSVADISSTDTLVFTSVSHHAVFQRETSVTHVALERSLTWTAYHHNYHDCHLFHRMQPNCFSVSPQQNTEHTRNWHRRWGGGSTFLCKMTSWTPS